MVIPNQTSTNPYESPLEPQSPIQLAKEEGGSSNWLAIRDCLILAISISASGGLFGMGLGGFFGLGAAFFGALIGFVLAFIPTVLTVVLCRATVPALLKTASQRRIHYTVGISSGALSGIVSTLFVMSSSLDPGAFLLAAGAALVGGLGGLLGSYWSSRWYSGQWSV